MQLHELMLYLHHSFLVFLTPEAKHRNEMGRIVQEKNGFTVGPGKSTRPGEYGDRGV